MTNKTQKQKTKPLKVFLYSDSDFDLTIGTADKDLIVVREKMVKNLGFSPNL